MMAKGRRPGLAGREPGPDTKERCGRQREQPLDRSERRGTERRWPDQSEDDKESEEGRQSKRSGHFV
jgi:hypothetical protein